MSVSAARSFASCSQWQAWRWLQPLTRLFQAVGPWDAPEQGAAWLIWVRQHTSGSTARGHTSCREQARFISVGSVATLALSDQSRWPQSNRSVRGSRCKKKGGGKGNARKRAGASTCHGKRWHYFSCPQPHQRYIKNYRESWFKYMGWN